MKRDRIFAIILTAVISIGSIFTPISLTFADEHSNQGSVLSTETVNNYVSSNNKATTTMENSENLEINSTTPNAMYVNETTTPTVMLMESIVIDNDLNFNQLLTECENYLSQDISINIDDMQYRIENEEVRTALTKWKFIKRLGVEFLEQFKNSDESNKEFLIAIINDTEILNCFVQGRMDLGQDRLQRALKIWKQIWDIDKESHKGFYSKLAIASGYAHSKPVTVYGNPSPVIDPVKRYQFYKKLNEDGMLFDNFTTYDVTYLSMIVNTKGTDDDIYWIHDYSNSEKPDLVHPDKIKNLGFSVPYGKKISYSTPWSLKDTLIRGGVCTRISQLGTEACQAYGIPATLINQPGHRAFLYLNSKNEWLIGNNIGGYGGAYKIGRTIMPWGDHPCYIMLLEDAYRDKEAYEKSQQLLWITDLATTNSDKLALINQSIQIQPYNYLAWEAKIDCLLEDNISSKQWNNLKLGVMKSFSQHPKIMFDLLSKFEDKFLEGNRVEFQRYILDINDIFSRVEDQRQDTVLRSLRKKMIEKGLYLAKFSFSGENAGRLMGIKPDVEYSLDGGNTYKLATEDDMLLTKTEIEAISENNNILLRIKGTTEPVVFTINKAYLKEKKINHDDKLNTISGLDESMEFSTDGNKTWTRYSNNNLPDLSGNITINVRIAAKDNSLASNIVSRKFVSASFYFDGENANKIMGISKGDQYSFDGGITYRTATDDNVILSSEEVELINSKNNIHIKTDNEVTIIIPILESKLRDRDIKSSDYENTLDGLNQNMEFSIDGKKTWIKYNDNLPDLSGIVTIHIRRSAKGRTAPSNIITRKYTPAKFSFDGKNAGRLMGITTNIEYSLDAGKTFKIATERDMMLNKEEIKSINTENGILLRVLNTEKTYKINIAKGGLLWSTIKSNDTNNTLTGLRNSMEFSTDNMKTWTRYSGNNIPDLTGNLSIHVRKAATGTVLPSNIVTRKFTAATFSFSGVNAGKLMGITPKVEYSLDGGETYLTPSENNILLNKEELELINQTDGILLRDKDNQETIVLTIKTSYLADKYIHSNNVLNTITGITSAMEFSIDGKETWTKYNGNNLPDLSGNVTIYVRKSATGNILPSNAIEKKFTRVTFSFDQENAGRIMGIYKDEQYSLDGGETFKTAEESDVLLSSEELKSINEKNGIIVKMNDLDHDVTISIQESKLRDRDIKSSNYDNTLSGLSTVMEFSTDNKVTWTRYTENNIPDLSGILTIHIRRAAVGTRLASNIITRKFTPATFSFDGQNACKLMGITTNIEYSLDGGQTYKLASEKDMLLSKEEIESISAEHGILLRVKNTDDIYKINISKNGLITRYIKADDNLNTLTGMRTNFEFSIDGKNTWKKYTGDNLPDLSGDITIYVRKHATGTKLPSNIATRKFTK